MSLNRFTGVVFMLLSVAFFAFAQGVTERNKPAAYVVATLFFVIGVWRFFARKGH